MKIKHFKSKFIPDQSNIKKAIIIIEGTHKDSDGNSHTFSKKRLEDIVNNSNRHRRKFNIKLVKDHKITFDNIVGNVQNDFELRQLTEDDLPPEYRDDEEIKKELVGKYAIFNSAVEITDNEILEKINKNNNISMGLCVDDKDDEKIIELSVVPIPAIPHMRLFNNPMATTWAELETNTNDIEGFNIEYQTLCDNLYLLLMNTKDNINNDIINTTDLDQKLIELLNGFSSRLIKTYNNYFMPDISQSGNMVSPIPRFRGMREDNLVTNQQKEFDINRANSYITNTWFKNKLAKKRLYL